MKMMEMVQFCECEQSQPRREVPEGCFESHS